MKRSRDEAKSFKIDMGKYEFVQKLAKGLDPLTNKRLFVPSEELKAALNTLGIFVLRYEKIDKNSFRAIKDSEEIEEQKNKILAQKRAKQTQNENNIGSVWTQEEDAKLIEEYNSNISIEEMMSLHGRTRSAIERRILKLIPISDIRK